EALSSPLNGNGICPGTATVATGSAVTTVGGRFGPAQTSTVPLITEILPALQFGDVNIAGDIPIGGSIKVSGSFPVYGVVSVEGAVPSTGTAIVNAGGGMSASIYEPGRK
ncbi:Hdd1-like protein, partial [Operophtera brumata]